MSDAIVKQLNLFLSKNQLEDKQYTDKLIVDIILSYLIYETIPSEYFLFNFPNCTPKRRREFLTLKHKDLVMMKKVGTGYNWDILEDKELFYKKFQNYFHRDVCVIKSNEDIIKFDAFVHKNTRFIAKPLNGQCGKNVEIYDVTKYPNIADLFHLLLETGSWICEELIVADSSISQWNSSSLNTVRIPSFLNSKGFFVLKPVFRIGRKGSVVDNANSGGIIVVVDEKTGILKTNGVDMRGDFYEKHPDSGIVFKGFQIPRWNELLDLVERIHRNEMPNYPYIGWDFALTEKGWVLIEGNWGQFLSEFADREGIKKKFDSLFD